MGITPDVARAYFNSLPASAKEFDHESDASDYDANERVGAGYAMAEIYLGSKLLLLPGVRVESTRVRYTGYDVLYNDDGDYASTQAVMGRDSYTQFLPSAHLRYAIDQDTNIRAAYTRTLARPNYYDLVPYQLVSRRIWRSNAAIRHSSRRSPIISISSSNATSAPSASCPAASSTSG